MMRRSKLQMYVDVLDVLVFHGPMRVTRITSKANLSYGLLKPILNNLIEDKLVEERKSRKNEIVYAATNAARKTLLKLEELTQILPITQC